MQRLKWALQVWAFSLLSLLVLRLALWGVNYSFFRTLDAGHLLQALVIGLRFDLATLAICQGVVLLVVLWPLPPVSIRRRYGLLALLLTALALPWLAFNVVDIAYFRFTQRRSTFEVAELGGDILRLSGTLLAEYWWLVLLFAAQVYGYYTVLRRLGHRVLASADFDSLPHRRAAWLPASLSFLVVAALLFLSIRGGLQRIPLRPADAFQAEEVMVGHLGLNSFYTVLHSLSQQARRPLQLLPPDEARQLAQQLVLSPQDSLLRPGQYPFWRVRRPAGPPIRRNVVIILLESFAAQYVGVCNGKAGTPASLTPHLDSLAAAGLFFPNFYANGTRSMEVFPSVLNGLPDLFSRPIIGSEMETYFSHGLGYALRAAGYHTAMYHGGINGSLGLDSYSRLSGWGTYYGKNEYPEPAHYNGTWGIHDGRFLPWAARRMQQQQAPWAAVLFSLSSHHPFAYEADRHPDLAQAGLNPFEQTVRYTDRALGQLIQTFRQAGTLESTLFVITADHSFHYETDTPPALPDNYRTPLVLYAPGLIAPQVSTVPGSPVNIPATVLHLLHLPGPYAAMGSSLLDTAAVHFAANHYTDLYSFETETHCWQTNLASYEVYLQRTKGGWQPSHAAIPAAERRRYLAYIQTAHNCIIANKIAPVQ
jgi:phosphoglycerol transferase MdoB-like AlkP superfamily enzyme